MESMVPPVEHPGVILKQVLKDRQVSIAELARRTGVSTKHMSEIANGHTGFSGVLAVKMERALGGFPKAEFWLKAQADYQIYLESQVPKDGAA